MAREQHAGRDAVRITTAATSRQQEIAARQRRYVMSMAVRTVCFVGAVVVDGWLRWVLVAAAVLLPYVAVVMANAVLSKDDGFALPDQGPTRPELTGAAPEAPRPEGEG